jgi:hypothetical protein
MLSDSEILRRVEAYQRCGGRHGSATGAARVLGLNEHQIRKALKIASERGLLLDHEAAMPGFHISQVTTNARGERSIQQRPEAGEVFEAPDGLKLKGVTALIDANGRILHKHIMLREDRARQDELMRLALAALREEVPRCVPVNTHSVGDADLLNQYTLTDHHFGMMSWGEETGGADYDLKIAEQLLLDWFSMAIKLSPDAHTAILAQLGDLLHFDGTKAVTPTSGHILDADSRFAKVVRVVIRTLRRLIRMLLEKHAHVHLVMADANHDPASEIWLREMLASFYEDEPRVTVDRSPGSYYAYEWGQTSLFYHHGHQRGLKDVDTTWVARFRELFGRTKFSYGHTGHFHSDAVFPGKLVKVERHETLAAASSYEANRGYVSGRSAKVITYNKHFGEVGRHTLTPEMVHHGQKECVLPCD